MKGIASQQRKVASPASSTAARLAQVQATARVEAASVASVSSGDAALNTEITTIKARLDAAAIP